MAINPNTANVDRNKVITAMVAGMMIGKSNSHITKLQSDGVLPKPLTVGVMLDYIASGAAAGGRRKVSDEGERQWYIYGDEATMQQIINSYGVKIEDPRELARERNRLAKEDARKQLAALGLA